MGYLFPSGELTAREHRQDMPRLRAAQAFDRFSILRNARQSKALTAGL